MKDNIAIQSIESAVAPDSYNVSILRGTDLQIFVMKIERGDIQVVTAKDGFWRNFQSDPMMAGQIMKHVLAYHNQEPSLEFPINLERSNMYRD